MQPPQNQRTPTQGDKRLHHPGRKRSALDSVSAALTPRQGAQVGEGEFSVSGYSGEGRDRYRRSGAFSDTLRAQKPGYDRALR